MRRAEYSGRTILFIAVTIFLIAVIAFCISGTVMSRTEISNAELETYYRLQEKELLSQTKIQLDELGYKNSGVTLTRVVDAGGKREYTITIHHGKIDKMSAEERSALIEILEGNTFFGGYEIADMSDDAICGSNAMYLADCSIYHEFLMYE